MSDLTDDAYVFGFSYFPSKGSTLSFGGDNAKMKITDRSRAALNELIEIGYVETCEALDSYPGKEHYKAIKGVRVPSERKHLNPFSRDAKKFFGWKTFVKDDGSK